MPSPEPPSTRTLAIATVAALVVAALILAMIVLPAEYGVDPLGTGKTLGLMPVSEPEPADLDVPAGATSLAPVAAGPVARYDAPFKFDSAQFELGPYEYVEYKYRLEKGASMLYSWTASSSVLHDFHGDRADGPPGVSESFDKQNKQRDQGAFVAPFSGIHGWYWENPGGETITVRLTSAGFYTTAQEFQFDRTRRFHDLTSLDEIAIPGRAGSNTGAP